MKFKAYLIVKFKIEIKSKKWIKPLIYLNLTVLPMDLTKS